MVQAKILTDFPSNYKGCLRNERFPTSYGDQLETSATSMMLLMGSNIDFKKNRRNNQFGKW